MQAKSQEDLTFFVIFGIINLLILFFIGGHSKMAKQTNKKKTTPTKQVTPVVNLWTRLSRGVCTVAVLSATFCGICALGVHFNSVPWGWIALGILGVLAVGILIWWVGYQSNNRQFVLNEDSNPRSGEEEEFDYSDEEEIEYQ